MSDTNSGPEQPPIPAGFTEHTVDVGGHTIRYLDGGSGDVLLVVHGGSGMARNISSVHSELAKEYRVVALELPGFGSTDGSGIESLRDLAAVVAAFASALAIEEYSLLGSSLGAAVSLWVAIDHREAVDKLVLDAPAAFREGAPPPGPPPPGAGVRAPNPAQMAFMRKLTASPNEPGMAEAMVTCDVPALVLFGQADPLFPPRYAVEYKRLPRASVAIVYAASHDVKGSRPEAYLETVSDFLRRGLGFVVMKDSTLIRA